MNLVEAMLAGVLPLGQSSGQGAGAGIAIRQAQAGSLQQLAGVHGGDPVDAAQVGEAQPFTVEGLVGERRSGGGAVGVAGGGGGGRRAPRAGGAAAGATGGGHGWSDE
jgi:hypothetical protein